MITREQLLEWDTATAKATPEPWRAHDNAVWFQADQWRALIATTSTERDNWRNDAAFIAAARVAMPLLLAEIKILKDPDNQKEPTQ